MTDAPTHRMKAVHTNKLDAYERQSTQHLRALATEDLELFVEGVVTQEMAAAVTYALRYVRAKEAAARA